MLVCRTLQLDLGHFGHGHHPHISSSPIKLCCDRKPHLEAICILERYDIVERSEDFIYKLTPHGRTSARFMLSTVTASAESILRN